MKKQIKKIIKKIAKKIIININIYIINPILDILEELNINFLGNVCFYRFTSPLDAIERIHGFIRGTLIRRFEDFFKEIFIEYIWKIKRSNSIICKILKKILSNYDWFNNNIIKF